MFKPRKKTQEQKEFWVVADRLPKASPSRFYELLHGTLERMGFAGEVWERCAPAYADATKGGRPGIDPGSPITSLRYSPPPPRWCISRC